MNNRHRKTLERIYADPVAADLRWADIEALLVALGAKVREAAGSRVKVVLNGQPAVFHRPHPQPEAKQGAVRAVRMFLSNAGIKP